MKTINKISVVMSTFQRATYLKRSLKGYGRCTHSCPFDIIVLDDGSTDETEDVCTIYRHAGLDIKYVRIEKDPTIWRDCAATINRGLRMAVDGGADLIIATHPEVIPGVASLDWMAKNAVDGFYLANKIYYLTPADQEKLDTTGWQLSNLAVRLLPDFYTVNTTEHRGNPAYSHENTDATDNWESWVFGGMTTDMWRFMGGFRETDAWGTIDMDFMVRRSILGVHTITAMEEDTICIHQNHDVKPEGATAFVATPRDMEKASASGVIYRDFESARLHHLD